MKKRVSLPVIGSRAPRKRRALLAILGGMFAMVCLLAAGAYLIPRKQVGGGNDARRTDADKVKLDEVYLDVTYATPELLHRVKLDEMQKKYGERAQGFLVGVNTHVGDIHACHFAGTLKLVDSNGDEYPSLGQPVVVSHHHNLWAAFFPRLDNHGKPIFDAARKTFAIRADGIGGIPHREYRFELPIATEQPSSLLSRLHLWLAVLGAMLVVLSPCAVELTAYYTAIIAGTLGNDRGEPAQAFAEAGGAERRRVLKSLLAFAAGFTLLYSFSGATIGLIGQTVSGQVEIFGDWKPYLHAIGAILVGYFGLRVLGVFEIAAVDRILSKVTGRFGRFLRGGVARILRRKGGMAPVLDGPKARITPASSFLLGIGLSVGCLTCMGGAIVYPLMIFAGTSRWYWGAMTLALYSAGIAIPMLFITLGAAELRPRLSRRLAFSRALQGASGALLLAIAILIAVDRERALFDPVFRLLARMGV